MSRPRPPEAVVRLLWALGDAITWFVAVVFTVWMRFQYDLERALVPNTWIVAGSAALIHILAGLIHGPYLVKHVRASFEEVIAVARAAFLTAVALGVWAIFLQPYVVPRSVPAVGGAVALTLMMAGRFVVRAYRSRKAVRREVDNNVIIYGAGRPGSRRPGPARDRPSGPRPGRTGTGRAFALRPAGPHAAALHASPLHPAAVDAAALDAAPDRARPDRARTHGSSDRGAERPHTDRPHTDRPGRPGHPRRADPLSPPPCGSCC
ncbi:hypothetical protein ACQBAT_13895 [Ornithinimicrobium sp. Y1847]|uniref:hypothetical protein n=1 Tax=Ornithinimicrobium sp. Y1847 TaxID=3405419 RepID=UPI003B682F9A